MQLNALVSPSRARLNWAALVAPNGLTLGLSACDRAPQAPAAPGGVPTGDAQKAAEKVNVCHVDVTGRFHLISIKANAWPAHQAHGDGLPLGPVPGDGGSVFDAACVSHPVPVATRVFVSSTSFSGNLGGLAGADNLCETHAALAGLPGIWRAWLSDSVTSAADRLTHADGPYRLMDDTVIAADASGFFNTSHLSPINLNEHGLLVSNAVVWTGSNGSGVGSGGCSNFTNNSVLDASAVGLSSAIDSAWSSAFLQSCDREAHLYCIEQ